MEERLAVNSFVEKILTDAIPRHFLDISIGDTKENDGNYDLQNSAQRNSKSEKYDFCGFNNPNGSSLDNLDALINNCLDSVAFGVNKSLSTNILSKCLQMGGGYQNQEYLKRNMLIPSGNIPFMCSVCGLEFENQNQITDHIKVHKFSTFDSAFNINNLGMTSNIEIVPLSSKVSSPLTKKIYNTNNDLKPNECSECGKSFASPYGLKRHKLMHLPVKPFNCKVCGKGFTERSKLKIHLYTHAGIRPFECSECGSSFREKNRLVKHMQIHSEKRDFKCKDCGKVFGTEHNLKRHTMVHAENKEMKFSVLNNNSITLERL